MNLIAPDGLEYMPFQREGIAWATAKLRGGAQGPSRSVLIADEMGLGKTIQAIGILNQFDWRRVLIVCPASLRLNWKREIEKWLVRQVEIGVIVDGKNLPSGDILVCNFELLGKHPLKKTHWDFVIVDEFHSCKSPKAIRTKEVMALPCRHFIALTGTPILNRPSEAFTICHKCAPNERSFKSWWSFVHRYCDAHQGRFGLDVSGNSNLHELRAKMQQFMIRRLKKDVLRDLPPKRRQIIELPPTNEMKLVRDKETAQWKVHEEVLLKLAERRDQAKLLHDETAYRAAAAELKRAFAVSFAEMAKVRQETALAKLPLCIKFIQDTLDEVDKIIVFAHHKKVIENLMLDLADAHPVRIVGDDSIEDRQLAVDLFQTNPKHRIFVGSIKAAGVGITLTASSLVIFVESDWTPALLCQAEDRSHRHGQRDSVLIQHLVLEASIDAYMLKKVMRKQEVIDQALDGGIGEGVAAEPDQPRAKRDWAAEGKRFTQTQRACLIRALRCIADNDKDAARQKNGEGFSAYHTDVGCRLAKLESLSDAQAGFAASLVHRYRKQVATPLLLMAGIEEK